MLMTIIYTYTLRASGFVVFEDFTICFLATTLGSSLDLLFVILYAISKTVQCAHILRFLTLFSPIPRRGIFSNRPLEIQNLARTSIKRGTTYRRGADRQKREKVDTVDDKRISGVDNK